MEKREFFEAEKTDYGTEIVELIREKSSEEVLGEQLKKYHANDIAGILVHLNEEELGRVFKGLDNETLSEVFSYLDDAGEYLSTIDREEAADIIENMDADDAHFALDDLDEQTRNEVLELIEDEEIKEDIELIESYEEEQFGSKMSTNYIAVRRGITIKEAMRGLIAEAAENDNIYTVFVVDEEGKFYGAIDLKALIVARSDDDFESLISKTFPFVYDRDNISDNIERLRGYSEGLIPVVSSEDRRLLGVITANVIIDMVDDALGEDYAKLAALTEEEEPDETLLRSIKKRVPWLIVLMFMGLGVSAVVGLFEGVVDALPMIVSFQSLILGMAGNVGTQSLAVTVRVLGQDENFGIKKQLNIIAKETRVAFLNGVVIGVISFLITAAYLFLLMGYGIGFALSTAGCIGTAMCFAMMISGFTGAVIPLCLYRMGFDPAVASGPLITTVNDLAAVVSYYGLAWALLLH